MNTEATPLFRKLDRRDSCVVETRFSKLGLYIVVEAFPSPEPKSVLVEVFFPYHRGFFLLDEGDMPSWLGAECFRTGHLLYRITHGGWFSEVTSENGLLAIASASSNEWLVVTANERAGPVVLNRSPRFISGPCGVRLLRPKAEAAMRSTPRPGFELDGSSAAGACCRS